MALPKKNKKNINIVTHPIQGEYPSGYNGITVPDRRKELGELMTEDGTFLPKSVLHADLDKGMLEFVQNQLESNSNGKKINVIDRILTLQRWGEFAQTWSFSDQDKNVSLPFIAVVRQPDVQYGTNPALQHTIPDRKQFHFVRVPTWDGNRKGYDIYTIPQPVPVDITYNVKIVCNRMRELNVFNRVTLQKFTSRQAYTFVKGHYIPIILNTIGDESVVDTEERRYYQQSYQFQLQGFLIDEEEFEVKPAISRSMFLYGFDENTTKGERKSLDAKNSTKIKNKLLFGKTEVSKTISYQHKVNINVSRLDNVSDVVFYVNGVAVQSNLMISPNPGITLGISGHTYSNNSLQLNNEVGMIVSPYNGGTMCLMTSPLKPTKPTISLWFKKDSYDYQTPGQISETLIDNRGNNGTVGKWGFRVGTTANGRISVNLNTDLLLSPGLPWNIVTNPYLEYKYNSEYKTLSDLPTKPYYGVTGPGGNGWFNLVVTMDGRYMKIYINGELDKSVGGSTGSGSYLGNGTIDMLVDGQSVHYPTHPSYVNHTGAVGGYITGSGPAAAFNGVIDEIAVWDTVLDSDTIKNLYNNGEPKWDLNTAFYKDNLISWWRFEEGEGSVVKDHSTSGYDLDIISKTTNGAIWLPGFNNWSTDVPPVNPKPPGQGVDIVIIKVVPGQEASLTLEENIVR